MKTFKGKLDDLEIRTIRLGTNNGLTGYKIKKFQVLSADTIGAMESANLISVWKQDPGTAPDTIDFDSPLVLAAIDYRQHDNEGYGKYYTLLLGIKKLEFTLSLTWRTALNGNEKGQEIQKQHKRKKSQTPTASA